jgi:peptidylprolyl isomerase|eukprot:COSAG01_NODE_14023_length_1506_cov_1.452736_2_plen_90_part_00
MVENGSADESRPPIPFAKGMLTWWLGGGQVIAGLDEAVRGMRAGGQRKCKIPPSCAYGDQGDGPQGKIPPYATLIFDVELVRVRRQRCP